MSFGVNDLVAIGGLLATLIERVRNGPVEFCAFANDLSLVQACIRQIDAHRSTFSSCTSRLSRIDRNTTNAVFRDVRKGLEDLQRELDSHTAQNAIGRVLDHVVAERHRQLREQLQFQFSKLSILFQSFSLAQGARMAEALREIRMARLDDEDETLTANISDFRRKYVNRAESSTGMPTEEAAPTVVTAVSKGQMVCQWIKDVEKFESGTYLDGFSDNTTMAGLDEGRPQPPSRAFLWQFILWDISVGRAVQWRKTVTFLGLIFPAIMVLTSFGFSSYLLWTATVDERGRRMGPGDIFDDPPRFTGSAVILITSCIASYTCFIYKHSGKTCRRLARVVCYLGLSAYILVLVSGVLWCVGSSQYWPSASTALLGVRTVICLVFGNTVIAGRAHILRSKLKPMGRKSE